MLRVKKCRMIEMHVCTVYTGTHERIPKYAVVYQAAYVVYSCNTKRRCGLEVRCECMGEGLEMRAGCLGEGLAK